MRFLFTIALCLGLFDLQAQSTEITNQWVFEKAVIKMFTSDAQRSLIKETVINGIDEVEGAKFLGSMPVEIKIGLPLYYVEEGFIGSPDLYYSTIRSEEFVGYTYNADILTLYTENEGKWDMDATYNCKIESGKLELNYTFNTNTDSKTTVRFEVTGIYSIKN